VTALVLSSLAGRRRGFPRGVAGVRGEGVTTSTAVRVSPQPAAHPGGFGNSDRIVAGLQEARVTHHDLNQRRVRAGRLHC
jgi:hypothetical protein